MFHFTEIIWYQNNANYKNELRPQKMVLRKELFSARRNNKTKFNWTDHSPPMTALLTSENAPEPRFCGAEKLSVTWYKRVDIKSCPASVCFGGMHLIRAFGWTALAVVLIVAPLSQASEEECEFSSNAEKALQLQHRLAEAEQVMAERRGRTPFGHLRVLDKKLLEFEGSTSIIR